VFAVASCVITAHFKNFIANKLTFGELKKAANWVSFRF